MATHDQIQEKFLSSQALETASTINTQQGLPPLSFNELGKLLRASDPAHLSVAIIKIYARALRVQLDDEKALDLFRLIAKLEPKVRTLSLFQSANSQTGKVLQTLSRQFSQMKDDLKALQQHKTQLTKHIDETSQIYVKRWNAQPDMTDEQKRELLSDFEHDIAASHRQAQELQANYQATLKSFEQASPIWQQLYKYYAQTKPKTTTAVPTPSPAPEATVEVIPDLTTLTDLTESAPTT
ncbi:MAG: hypothetical protein Tsb005_09250 [Gammaproteobacteria bacterium]